LVIWTIPLFTPDGEQPAKIQRLTYKARMFENKMLRGAGLETRSVTVAILAAVEPVHPAEQA
jgi:hypothetical protein